VRDAKLFMLQAILADIAKMYNLKVDPRAKILFVNRTDYTTTV